MDLLKTKLYMPPPRPNLVARPALWARLSQGLEHGRPLALISAPAGYGKTTLAAAWLARDDARPAALPPNRVAWLALDEEDNDPLRFFAAFMAAFAGAGVDWGSLPGDLREMSQLPPPRAWAAALLNQITAPGDDRALLLALDDYHKINHPLIHETLATWIEHAPPFVQLLLITREDPPLPLPRWRAQARLTEIRAGDLQFSPPEAADFLTHTMGLNLSRADVLALEQRTEGWIAGLQLAATALQYAQTAQDSTDAAAFIRDFSGGHHYVIDYLVEEVLRRQPDDLRGFLEQTAVLDRLSAPLCDALTGRSDSQAMLAHLARANLFLVPLDNQQQWYRYHHLLAGSLRARLDPAQEAALHARAAAWCESNGRPVTAVQHALATGDLDLAAGVIERAIQNAPAWSRGDVGRLKSWLEALPEPLLRARPALSLHASRAYYLAGDLDRSAQLLAQAEASLRDNPAAATDKLAALTAVYRGAIAALRGERLDEVIRDNSALLEGAAPLDRHTLARAADTLGLAYELRGDTAAAERAYLQAADLAGAAGVDYLAINGRGEAALVQISAGRLTQAAQTCRQALAIADAIPPAGLAWAILGEIARERDDLAEAEEHLARGIALGRQGGISDDLRFGHLFMARLRRAQGDFPAARAAWRAADAIMQGYRVPRLAALSAAARARLALAAGDLPAALAWAESAEFRRAASAGDVPLHEFETLTLARVRLAQGEFAAAAEQLIPLLEAAQENGRGRAVIEALILLSLAYEGQGQTAAAEAALRRALLPAAAEGFTRLFLDEGPALTALLPRARTAAPAFADDLLAAFDAAGDLIPGSPVTPGSPVIANTPPVISSAARNLPTADALPIDPLSEREQEVLALLVAGLSNDDIAAQLFITTGTAKWHVHNIYQKLDVGSRAQAIARAHEWRLV